MLPVRVDPTGETGPTRRQARGPRWRRTSNGFYVPSHVPATPAQRTVEASVLVPADGAITGWAALGWLGANYCTGTKADGTPVPVPLIAPGWPLRKRSEVLVSGETLPPEQVLRIDGLRVTTPAWAAVFEACRAKTVDEATEWYDLGAAADLFTLAEVRQLLAGLGGRRGIRQAQESAALAEENAWSRTETRMRLVLLRKLGLRGLLCNTPVFDLEGRFLGTPDLLDPVAAVAFEYDGEKHWRQRGADLAREGRLTAAGLQVVHMVNIDLRDSDEFLTRVREAYKQAARRPVSERRWSIDAPPWWTPTVTVAQRRALSEWQRERYLGWQRLPVDAPGDEIDGMVS